MIIIEEKKIHVRYAKRRSRGKSLDPLNKYFSHLIVKGVRHPNFCPQIRIVSGGRFINFEKGSQCAIPVHIYPNCLKFPHWCWRIFFITYYYSSILFFLLFFLLLLFLLFFLFLLKIIIITTIFNFE